MDTMMNYWGYGRGSIFWPGFGIFDSIVSILFWILLIGLIVSLFKRHHTSDEVSKDEEPSDLSNLEIIKRRYAQGEITKKEYEEMKRELD